MQTTRCPQCGRPNDVSNAGCWGCGSQLDSTPEPLPAVLLGQYQVIDLLGRGGMSAVYRARHQLTEQEVAIKVLLPELATYDDVKARFVQEARTLAKLEHPNVVALHNFVEEQGKLCLVMQYAEGETFESVIYRSGKLTFQQAVPVIIHVLRALEYAHKHGVVHRDIKPSNILVRSLDQIDEPGCVKVTDFGIAKITQGEMRMTQTGQTMGTVSYMSPEQVKGETADGRADLYSLGVTLYEAVTGRLPFEGQSHFEVMTKHVNDPATPPSQLGVDISPQIEGVLMRSLAKKPSARYDDAISMRVALEQGLAQGAPVRSQPADRAVVRESSHDMPVARGSKGRWLALAAGTVLLVGGTSVLLAFWPKSGGGASAGDAGQAVVAPPKVDAGPPAPREHPLLRRLVWKHDRRFAEPSPLRVLADDELADVEAIKTRVSELRDRFQSFLKEEKVTAPSSAAAITVAVVSQAVVSNPSYFTATNVNFHYFGKFGTIYITPDLHDLPYTVAFHLCPPRLGRDTCLGYAARFSAANEITPPKEEPKQAPAPRRPRRSR